MMDLGIMFLLWNFFLQLYTVYVCTFKVIILTVNVKYWGGGRFHFEETERHV